MKSSDDPVPLPLLPSRVRHRRRCALATPHTRRRTIDRTQTAVCFVARAAWRVHTGRRCFVSLSTARKGERDQAQNDKRVKRGSARMRYSRERQHREHAVPGKYRNHLLKPKQHPRPRRMSLMGLSDDFTIYGRSMHTIFCIYTSPRFMSRASRAPPGEASSATFCTRHEPFDSA